jgi:hypothetical protein
MAWYSARVGDCITAQKKARREDSMPWDAAHYDAPLYTHPAAPVPAVQSAAKAIAAEQAEDTGLWFVATTVSEAHLQAALRRLTAAVEGEAP